MPEERTRSVSPERALARVEGSSVEIADLRRRIMLLSPTDRIELGMDFSEHETAREKLERLARFTEHLGRLAAEVTVDLFRENPKRFSDLLIEIDQVVAGIATDMAIFEATVTTQYPKATSMQKLMIVLLALLRGVRESTLLDTLGNNERTRRAFFSAKSTLDDLRSDYFSKIEQVKEEVIKEERQRLIQTQWKILKADARYQGLLEKKFEIEADKLTCQRELAVSNLIARVGSTQIYALCQKYGRDVTRNNLLTAIFAAESLTQNKIDALERAALLQAREELSSKTPGQ